MIGNLIAEYEIIEKIGQGGMGEVYKAVHTRLDQTVAVKVLSSEYSPDPSMRKRFVNEAKIQAKFSHPNMVNIFNLIEQDNNIFIVMEYVNGQTLEKYIEAKGTLSQKESVEISHQVLNALQFMHSKGVVHRDIKPSNIMFTDTGVVKVTDFGIAKVMNENTKHTSTGMMGSVVYISPEQILGEKTSDSTDIYSFGITLYKMVTGMTPFRGNSEYIVMQGHLKDKPIAPIKYNENITKSLNNLILKSISKEPEKRYASVQEMIETLKQVNNKDSLLSNISYALRSKIENMSSIGYRNMAAMVGGLIITIALLNIAVAKITDSGSEDITSASVIDETEINTADDDIQLEDYIAANDTPDKLFENKYVIFEPTEDLTDLNNAGNQIEEKPVQQRQITDPYKSRQPKSSNITNYKKVYYKPKKNQTPKRGSNRKWKIRK